ncbi:MAG: TfoX/Sxy family protein [Polyangiales bacterium]
MPKKPVVAPTAPKPVDSLSTYLVETLTPLGDVKTRRMFGAAGLDLDDLIIGLIDGGRLYFKVDDMTRPQFEAAGMEPFECAPGQVMKGYWRVPSDVIDDDRALRKWATQAHGVSVRASEKPTKAKTASKKRATK